jgi:hypothetical protein
VIKLIRFVTRAAGIDAQSFLPAWRAAASEPVEAPQDTRPWRIVVCPGLSELTPDGKHDGVGIEWFADEAHLRRFDAWLQTGEGRTATERLSGILSGPNSPVMVADELVLRGADWLAQRWRDGGDRTKQMAIARRAAGLTAAQFSDRWRNRAGTIGSASGPAVVIPDEARGRAYVQNHPRPGFPGRCPYDALNEVYFDDVASLRIRAEWFAEHLTNGAESDLVSESWFLAAREEVLWDATPL